MPLSLAGNGVRWRPPSVSRLLCRRLGVCAVRLPCKQRHCNERPSNLLILRLWAAWQRYGTRSRKPAVPVSHGVRTPHPMDSDATPSHTGAEPRAMC
eukprot:7352743-Prymnesium_polylepis.1